jgi:hypothetical protein
MGKETERIITSALKAFVVLAAICSAQRGGCPCNKENESPWWRSSSAKWRLLCFDTDRPTGCPLSPEESSTYLRERVPQEGKGSESTHLRQVEIHVFFFAALIAVGSLLCAQLAGLPTLWTRECRDANQRHNFSLARCVTEKDRFRR